MRRVFFFIMLVASFAIVPGARAEYIDEGYTNYLKSEGHKAFAFTSMGSYFYVYSASSVKIAQEEAVQGCANARPRSDGGCQIGDVDGRVVHKRFRQVISGILKHPVDISITHRSSGKIEAFPGTVVIERYWSRNPTNIRVLDQRGRQICSNGQVSFNFGVRFNVSCWGEKYSGWAKRKGFQRTGFNRGALLFEAAVQSKDKILTVKTRSR